jgi:threonine dehydratase
MPTSASPIKRAAVIGYGSSVVPCEPTLAAGQTVARLIQQSGRCSFTYDDPAIIAGKERQLEFIADVADLFAIAPRLVEGIDCRNRHCQQSHFAENAGCRCRTARSR